MATSMGWKPEAVAKTPRAPDRNSFSARKVDDLRILKVAEHLTGYRQYSALLLIEQAMEAGATKRSREEVLKELISYAKKGGMMGDCIFVVLENLAMNEELKRPVLKLIDRLIGNGADPETKESARMSRKHIGDLRTPANVHKMLEKKEVLAEGHL